MKFQITASEGNQKVRWFTKAANLTAGLARARKEAKELLRKDIDKLDSIEVFQVDKETPEDLPGQTTIPGTEDQPAYRPPRLLPAPGTRGTAKVGRTVNHGD